MRTIHRHIASSFLLTFGMSFLVFTVVMSLGLIFKVNDFLVKGVGWQPILMIIGCGVPPLLSLSIPMSLMTASLLVFGRFSADGEITAMRACGISMHQILHMPVLISVLLTVVCLYINQELGPRGHYARKLIQHELGFETPLDLLELGKYVNDFPGLAVYIGRKQDLELQDIRIRDMTDTRITREIRAKQGRLNIEETADGRERVLLVLDDVRVTPLSLEMPWPAQLVRMEFNLSDMLKERVYVKRVKDFTMAELVEATLYPEEWLPRDAPGYKLAELRMEMQVELSKRLVLSLSCFAFVVLGVPLGIRAHRRESSVGVAISLVLVFNFYLFIIVAESLYKYPACRPDLIAWIPMPLSLLAGSLLIRRND